MKVAKPITKLEITTSEDLDFDKESSKNLITKLLFKCGKEQLEDITWSRIHKMFNKAQLIDLTNQLLGFFPSELLLFNNLTSLNLNNNHLKKLPIEIDNLMTLRKLFLSQNQLRCLPPSLANLKNLIVLDISHNRIVGLPSDLYDLKHLKNLDLSGNPLVFPPPFIVARGTGAILKFLKRSEILLINRSVKYSVNEWNEELLKNCEILEEDVKSLKKKKIKLNYMYQPLFHPFKDVEVIWRIDILL